MQGNCKRNENNSFVVVNVDIVVGCGSGWRQSDFLRVAERFPPPEQREKKTHQNILNFLN